MQLDIAKDVDVVMQAYNLIEYWINSSKTSRNLWSYSRDMSSEADNAAITDSE